ncbi:MAG: hypothetical protein QOE87_4548 [Gaiellales bacterium]|nr:hypothetical protein [Gaiellales bacterium]
MTPEASDTNASKLMQVSRALMRVYKEYLGRGPDRAHTHYAGADAIVCFLEGTLTPVERTLTTIAAHQRLRDTRTLIQDAAEAEMCRLVEVITGRAVVASTSGFDVRADVATEAFQLGPGDSGHRLVPEAARR